MNTNEPRPRMLVERRRAAAVLLPLALLIAGCAGPEAQDWRHRTATLDMQPSTLSGVVGYVTLAGKIDAAAFTPGALWMVVATPPASAYGLPINRFVKIDLRTNRFSDLFAVDGFANAAIATGAGSVWVAEGYGGEKVYRVDPESERIVATFEFPRNPIDVAFDGKAVWVLASEEVRKSGRILIRVAGLAVSRIDPSTNMLGGAIGVPPASVSAGVLAGSIAVGSGSVWIATGNGNLVRVDAATNQIVASIPSPDGANVGYRVVSFRDRLLLVRRLVQNRTQQITRTTIWEVDPTLNRLAENPADFKEEGLVLSLTDNVCWIGSTQRDAISMGNPKTFLPVGEPRRIGYPVYALVAGEGTLWAFAGAKLTKGDERNITWVTRLVPR